MPAYAKSFAVSTMNSIMSLFKQQENLRTAALYRLTTYTQRPMCSSSASRKIPAQPNSAGDRLAISCNSFNFYNLLKRTYRMSVFICKFSFSE